MKKVLYTKYNSLRKTEFQIKTSIVEIDVDRSVIKEAMNDKADIQLENMKKNYNIVKDAYKNINVIPYEETTDGLKFKFIKGKGLLEDVDFLRDDIEKIVRCVSQKLDIIMEVKDEIRKKFEISEAFQIIFPDCYPKDEMALGVANIDSIFSNFVDVDGKIWCIDYEWVFDFDVPEGYVIYRALLYLYTEKIEILKNKITIDDFLLRFNLDKESVKLYKKMEDCFQQYVHGKNRSYIYTDNYLKKTTEFNSLIEENAFLKDSVRLKENHIENLDKEKEKLNDSLKKKDEELQLKEQHISNLDAIITRQSEVINEVKRAIKNPLYGAGLATKKILNKMMYRFGSDEWKTKQQMGKYKYKYQELMLDYNSNYETWIKELESEETYDEVFSYRPKISVVIPVYNVLDKHLVPCIESVINQIYDNWELCLADDNSSWSNVRETLKKYESNEKIKIVYRKENGHISKATNSAIEIATGEYIAFMDCDDVIRPNALYEVVKKLNEDKEIDFIYSDEDKIDDDGRNRHMPHFKPDWSPDTFMSHMYTSHLGVYRKSIVDEIGGLRPGFEGAQDYDFTLRFTEKTDRIAHIPKVLYHWRVREESTAGDIGAKPYILEATTKSKEDALKRRGIAGKLELVDEIYQYRVNYDVKDNPLVSIIIPSKDNYDILERCIYSLTSITEYKNYEIILIDNGSSEKNKQLYEKLADKYDIKYVYEKKEFNFSDMCNSGVANAEGEYYLFLNDDIEIINEKWLTRMLGHAQLSHIGAVGAKLLYPDGKYIQHDGVINLKNGPVHALSGLSDRYIHYFGRNRLEYNYLAVTAACLLVEAGKFKKIGGFDVSLAVTYNDVDLCFKLVEAGYYNVVRNDAVLLHHESVSRGNDLEDEKKFKRLEKERERLYERHPRYKTDPFYNINLTQTDVDFAYNYDNKKIDYCKIAEKKLNERYSQKALSNIDILMVLNNVYIEGWAFIKGYLKNNDIDIKIYLYNEEHSFISDTKRVYRPDVAEANRDEKDVDFTGFRCEFPKAELPKGTYNIDVICKKERIKTDRTLEV